MLAICGNSVSQIANTNQIQKEKQTELSLEMERTGCYGTCPVYNLKVAPDGKVLFEGRFHTRTIGKAESNLSKEKINQVINETAKADFFSLKDSYTSSSNNCPNYKTDMATVTLSIRLNEKSKTIIHYLGCISDEETLKKRLNNNNSSNISVSSIEDFTKEIFPQQLYNLENKIDEIVETRRWIGERK